ncbi:MAG: pentapeptide repeat-containing protein [Pseudomonadales bacterium]|nr:pentapeptide repeat-containing protein [Pseudomonadales bacterium]
MVRKKGLEFLVKERVNLSGIDLQDFKLSRSELSKTNLYGAMRC